MEGNININFDENGKIVERTIKELEREKFVREKLVSLQDELDVELSSSAGDDRYPLFRMLNTLVAVVKILVKP